MTICPMQMVIKLFVCLGKHYLLTRQENSNHPSLLTRETVASIGYNLHQPLPYANGHVAKYITLLARYVMWSKFDRALQEPGTGKQEQILVMWSRYGD
jgi:hypothetical protein